MAILAEVFSPWKSCDLRGLYPETVSEELFHQVGSAIGSMLASSARVVVNGDFRLSTTALKQALIEGLLQAGVLVLDAGKGPTPLAYFAAKEMDADAVLMVTASHNPARYNGLKLMLDRTPTTPDEMARIRQRAEAGDFRLGSGKYERIEALSSYKRWLLERWRHLKPELHKSVVLDAGNGALSHIAPEIFRELGFKVECISCQIDGSFPDRSPDCSRSENLERLCQTVAQSQRSLGIAWDGDGDRVAFVDEEGSYVSAGELAILLARTVLEEHKAEATPYKIVIDIKFADVVRREIELRGGLALLERTGHAFMRGRMAAEDALLGLDACGHYFFRELDGGDDGLFAALFVLDMLQRKGDSLAVLRRTLPRIFETSELRIPLSLISYAEAERKLCEAFPEARRMMLDGTRLTVDDGVVLIRESGTEPVVSLRIEGNDAMGFQRIVGKSIKALPVLATLLKK